MHLDTSCRDATENAQFERPNLARSGSDALANAFAPRQHTYPTSAPYYDPNVPISPLQASTDVMDRADNLLTQALATPDPLVADDIRRSAIAMGVAALDTYLHWAIADVPLEHMPTALKGLNVPFGDLVDLSEAMVRNRAKIRPKVRARGVLERAILKLTFQSSRGVEHALLMLGKRNAFAKISAEIQPPQGAEDIKDRLDRVVRRRNQVVHEGDLQRQSRPQQVKREQTDGAAIKSDLDWLRTLILSIDKVLTT